MNLRSHSIVNSIIRPAHSVHRISRQHNRSAEIDRLILAMKFSWPVGRRVIYFNTSWKTTTLDICTRDGAGIGMTPPQNVNPPWYNTSRGVIPYPVPFPIDL
jgi:hypothetical protein